MRYKSNYPKIIPEIIHQYLFKIYSYITIPLTLFSDKLQIFTSSLLSNLTILSISAGIILYILNYFDVVISFNYIALFIPIFYISYIITHLQISPYEPIMINNYKINTNYSKYLLIGSFIYISTSIIYYLYSNLLFLNIILGLGITYYYNTKVFRKDVKNKSMDVYRVELWAPITTGIYYTSLLSLIILDSALLYVLFGLLFSFNTLSLHRFRINRFQNSKKYTYDDIYEKVGPKNTEITNTINSLQKENKLESKPDDIFDDKKLMSNLMMGNISLEEFKNEISIDENIDEDIKYEIRHDLKWSWTELYEQLIIYLKDGGENVKEPDFESFNKNDIIELKSEMIDIQNDLDENAPPNLKKSIQKYITKLEHSINYWEKMNKK